MGVAGIRIHGLKDSSGRIAPKGYDPFKHFSLRGQRFWSIVKCYNPGGRSSQERYAWISKYLAGIVEKAIEIRKNN